MQKIMYNERYGLEQAVIDGIKTMTRRTAYDGEISKPNWGICLEGKDKGKAYLCEPRTAHGLMRASLRSHRALTLLRKEVKND